MRVLLMVLALSVSGWLAAADSGIVVDEAWIREAPPSAHMLAAYMTIHNTSELDRTLVGVESPRFRHVMLHKSELVDGVARMRHQDQIALPAGSRVELQPGGLHLMMPAPETPLREGDRVEFVLHFAAGEPIRVQAEVRKKP